MHALARMISNKGINMTGHLFDDDCVCVDCGFDGAEWHHWKTCTYEGKASDAKKPICTAGKRGHDVYLPVEDGWEYEDDY